MENQIIEDEDDAYEYYLLTSDLKNKDIQDLIIQSKLRLQDHQVRGDKVTHKISKNELKKLENAAQQRNLELIQNSIIQKISAKKLNITTSLTQILEKDLSDLHPSRQQQGLEKKRSQHSEYVNDDEQTAALR